MSLAIGFFASCKARGAGRHAGEGTLGYADGMATADVDDVRFTVPLYTSAEAARYLTVKDRTFRSWVKGYRREFPDRPPVEGAPLISDLPPASHNGPSIPFIGLAEGMFLAALRKAGVPLQQIRPALELVRTKIGVEHALASRKLYVVGAQLLWEVIDESNDREARQGSADMIVLKNGQYVFREVIDRYLQQITYDEAYARRIRLPGYEVAHINANPCVNFGKPYFARTGVSLTAVQGQLRAGEPIPDIAEDFDLPIEEVSEVAQREGLLIG